MFDDKASNPGVPATYEICVNTTVEVVSTTGTLLNPLGNVGSGNVCGGFLGATSWCTVAWSTCSTSGGGWTPGYGWPCGANYGTMYSSNSTPTNLNEWLTLLYTNYPMTLTQTSTMQFERAYVVSLESTGSGGYQQWLSEIDGSTFDGVNTNDPTPLASYKSSNGIQWISPNTTGSANMFPTAPYCGLGGDQGSSSGSCQGATVNQVVSADPWGNAYWWEPVGSGGPSIMEGSFATGAFLHLTSMSYQPQAGQSSQVPTATIAPSTGTDGGTSPELANVTMNSTNTSASSSVNWTTTTDSATWGVQANLDASCETADCEATGEASGSISAGYSNTNTTQSGSQTTNTMIASSDQTVANWTTQPFIASATGGSAAECATPASGQSAATTVQGPCSAWLLESVWYPSSTWDLYVPTLEFAAQPTQGSIFATTCTTIGTGCFNNTASSPTTPSDGWGQGQNLAQLNPASVATFELQGSTSGFVGTVTPNDEDTFYLVDQVSSGPVESSQAQVLGVMLSQLGASTTSSCMGACTTGASVTGPKSGSAPTIGSTFTMGGTPVSGGGNQLALSDLDLCAPPVVTAQLWQNGCSADTEYTKVPPQTWAPIPLWQSGVELVAPYQAIIGKPVTCDSGTWSNATSYTYAWYQYVTSQNQNAWEPVTSGVQSGQPNTFVPPSGSTGKSFLCAVTATGKDGSTTVTSGAFEVVNG